MRGGGAVLSADALQRKQSDPAPSASTNAMTVMPMANAHRSAAEARPSADFRLVCSPTSCSPVPPSIRPFQVPSQHLPERRALYEKWTERIAQLVGDTESR
jgi:hypothetical protein